MSTEIRLVLFDILVTLESHSEQNTLYDRILDNTRPPHVYLFFDPNYGRWNHIDDDQITQSEVVCGAPKQFAT